MFTASVFREIASNCDAVRLLSGTLSPIVRSDSDKGKAIERWRRKVTGLKSLSFNEALYDSGTARIPAEISAESVGLALSDRRRVTWNEAA